LSYFEETVDLRYTIFNTPIVKSFLLVISLFFLKILGWEKVGPLPALTKYVIIVAPHTSNWDVFYGVILAFSLKLDARFIAKKELFRDGSIAVIDIKI
jgi:1-acyl-sn-glycerol-3-phosphate acyltransferase